MEHTKKVFWLQPESTQIGDWQKQIEDISGSPSFCVLPWIHIATRPNGDMRVCCVANASGADTGDYSVGLVKKEDGEPANFGNSLPSEAFNNDYMKSLRKTMLEGAVPASCKKCYDEEAQGISSKRIWETGTWHYEGVDIPALIEATEEDGTVPYKLQYLDLRLGHTCNLKCIMCSPHDSSMWVAEHKKVFPIIQSPVIRSQMEWNQADFNNYWHEKPEFWNEIFEQIPNIKQLYFAGGEPLITEEHYILLEEMIKQGRTDIRLSYNTNLSNLKFKDKDLLSLWKNFDNPIYISASIDHYGERAEYIRSGTDWGKVEANFKKAKKTPYINLQMNTVLSVFNYLTIYEFYEYLIDKKLYTPRDGTFSLYNMSTPPHLTAHILPPELKQIGIEKMDKTIELFTAKKFQPEQINQLSITTPWVQSQDTWNEHKKLFKEEVKRLDKIRGEDFQKVFPELAVLLEDERKRLWPV
jgi:sulfatase maturation enzyme AslB (radical SAM superfamily)